MAKESTLLTRYPVVIHIQPVMESAVLDERFSLYFVTGTMNTRQHETIAERMPRAAVSKLPIGEELCVFSALVSRAELDATQRSFIKLAKEWRGQYYSVTNRFVEEYERVLSGD